MPRAAPTGSSPSRVDDEVDRRHRQELRPHRVRDEPVPQRTERGKSVRSRGHPSHERVERCPVDPVRHAVGPRLAAEGDTSTTSAAGRVAVAFGRTFVGDDESPPRAVTLEECRARRQRPSAASPE